MSCQVDGPPLPAPVLHPHDFTRSLAPSDRSGTGEVSAAGARDRRTFRALYDLGMVDAWHVTAAARECAAFLEATVRADWDVGVPDLDMSVAGVIAHAAEGCLWYTIDLAASGKDLQTVEHRVKSDGSSRDLVDTLTTYAQIASAVIAASPDTARGFHPFGAADPSGFAAMACDELLIHTDDAARGLGLAFRPPDGLARSVLQRLFPWITPTDNSWEQLRWANGRIALGDNKRLGEWAWHCAPLAEWDGTVATRPRSPLAT